MSQLLQREDKISMISYNDMFYESAIQQHYPVHFMCEQIGSVPLNANQRPFLVSYTVRKNSELTKFLNYGYLQVLLNLAYFTNFTSIFLDFTK